jgi:hypothetical protein
VKTSRTFITVGLGQKPLLDGKKNIPPQYGFLSHRTKRLLCALIMLIIFILFIFHASPDHFQFILLNILRCHKEANEQNITQGDRNEDDDNA